MSDQTDICHQSQPPWLQEQAGIEKLLHTIIDRLDKNPSSKTGLTLNNKTLPELFELGENSDLIWTLLQTLFNKPAPIFSFHENKKRNHHEPVYTDARIRFLPQSEALIRQWLNRPVQASTFQLWQKIVELYKYRFPGDIGRLTNSKILVPGKTQEDIIDGFLEIDNFINDELTLRNISARCFWQDSKFLDNKEELLCQLYPQLKIKTRPVMVSVYLPAKIHGILFIENQDSYTQAMTAVPQALESMALVYSAGFKLCAQRIRTPEGVSLHFHRQSSNEQQSQFVNWWHTDDKDDWPIYFWGDLDYAGIDILGNLKRRFETIQAWQPGYQPMLDLLLAGGGHMPESTGKQGQKEAGITGCIYTDEKLLPALKQFGCFVDQEWVYE